MYFDFPPFKHVQYINDRPAPKYDLAKSNISPDWSGHLSKELDLSMVRASDPKGLLDLNSELAERYGVDPSRVVVTNATSEANWLSYLSVVSRGKKVLIEKPIYTPLLEMPRALSCKVATIKRRAPGYRFDLKELDRRLSKGVDLFVMQNLNNPTGKALFEPDLDDIARVLGKHGTPVLVDEVYRDFAMEFEGERTIPAFPSMVELYDKAIITSSVTKVYGAGGLVTGWMVAPKRYANIARQQKIFTVPMVNHQGNRTALEVLRSRHKVLPKEFRAVREKLNLVSMWARGRDDVEWSEPDGCVVGFLRYKYKMSSIAACERLYKDFEVRAIPGAFFHEERGFRIGVGQPYDVVKGALKRIDEFLDGLRKRKGVHR